MTPYEILDRIKAQAMAEISGGFDEDTDRDAAVEDYIDYSADCAVGFFTGANGL